MKVQVPRISKKQKDIIKNELRSQQNDLSRRLLKLFCCALHDEFEFGKDRCQRLIAKVNDLAAKHYDDEVFWYHIDRELIDYMGINFPRENYEEMDR